MEEDYQKTLEVIFAYGYMCCVFKHNIYSEHPEVLYDMPDSSVPLPPEFFVNPRFPPSVPVATDETTVGEHLSEAAKELEENAFAGD